MTLRFRAARDADEIRAAMEPIWHYFGVAPTPAAVENFTALIGPERMIVGESVAEKGHDAIAAGANDIVAGADDIVAGCGSFPMVLTVPGGEAKCAGLTMVGVRPTHRRRGILTAMMRRFIDDARARGEPLAYLWASEERIYGRFGFGLSALAGDVEIAREHAALTTEAPQGDFAYSSLEAALPAVRAIYDAARRRRPGMFARSDDWLTRRVLADPAWRRGGGGEGNCILLRRGGAPAAYALYRMDMNLERGVARGFVRVEEAMGADDAALRAIWAFLLDLDWNAGARAALLPLDHPLVLSVAEPRRLNFTLRDGCWLRIVDAHGALNARRYGPAAPVVIEVTDEFCPWNAGRWRIGADGAAQTFLSADLSCDAGALASVYLGGFTWRELVAAGRAKGAEEAARRADRIFERGPAPGCPEIF